MDKQQLTILAFLPKPVHIVLQNGVVIADVHSFVMYYAAQAQEIVTHHGCSTMFGLVVYVPPNVIIDELLEIQKYVIDNSHSFIQKIYCIVDCGAAITFCDQGRIQKNKVHVEQILFFVRAHARLSVYVDDYDVCDIYAMKHYQFIVGKMAAIELHGFVYNARKLYWLIESFIQAQASCTVHVGLLIADNQQVQIQSLQFHEGQESVSVFVAKAVLGGCSSFIYRGKIYIGASAVSSDAMQEHKALLLSEQVFSESKPELEVCTHAVTCRHASAVGFYDEEMVWYLCSRGIERRQGEKFLMESFFVFDQTVDDKKNVAIQKKNSKIMKKFFK
jgi:Fe-S cluster assembly scaffold protein SufB